MTVYSAVNGPYHYPEGVIVPGESVELSDEDAARGLASGQIVPTPLPAAKAVTAALKSEPEEPA